MTQEHIDALKKIESDIEGVCRFMPAAFAFRHVEPPDHLEKTFVEIADTLGEIWSDVSNLVRAMEGQRT